MSITKIIIKYTAHILIMYGLLIAIAFPVDAHPGGTDANGGHYDHQTGEYHYHHGYGPHQHYDIDGDGVLDCPYLFVDKTGQNSGNSTGKTANPNSTNAPIVIPTSSPIVIPTAAPTQIPSVEPSVEPIPEILIEQGDTNKSTEYRSVTDNFSTADQAKEIISEKGSRRFLWGIPIAIVALYLLYCLIDCIKEKKEKAVKDAAYNARKDTFIRLYGGMNMHSAAGIPEGIRFIPDKRYPYGLPIDDNRECEYYPYGSFTVYISPYGEYYHNDADCYKKKYHTLKYSWQKFSPEHAFDALEKQLAPCPYCVNKPRTIPDWYDRYKRIKKEADELGIIIQN